MSPDSEPRTQPDNWSKGFIEHMRTVHFALMTVAAGLILILSSKTYDPRLAAGEMTEVMRQVARWKQTGLRPGGGLVLSKEPSVPFTTSFQAVTEKTHEIFTFTFTGTNLFLCDPAGSRYKPFNSALIPDNLIAFKAWWNASFRSSFVFADSVLSVAQEGLASAYSLPQEDQGARILTNSKVSSLSKPIALQISPRCNGSSMLLEGAGDRYYFNFLVAKVDRSVMEQPPLEGVSVDDWGEFDLTWPNLIDAARGREDLDFETLAPQIYSEAAKGDEAFETLGIKFPAELVTKYGLILLAGIQLYLLLFLKRLSANLAPDDPGWKIPWMGVDQSYLGRTMTFATLYVLPFIASFVIAFRAVRSDRGDDSVHLWGLPGGAWTTLFTVAMSCLCIALCHACWRYRPNAKRSRASLLLMQSAALGSVHQPQGNEGSSSA